MVVIKLFEIADRLADQAADGVLNSRSLTIGTEWRTLETAWLAATVFNDGDADVYIHLDDVHTTPWSVGEAPLKKGEQIAIDLRAKGHKSLPSEEPKEEGRPRVAPVRQGSPILSFICQSGTATIRVFRLA